MIVDYPRPDGTGQSFTFAPATTDRVRILASRLRPVGGEYYLQLAEIELPAADVDGDEVPDDLDNCPAVWSADQVDTDADGVGDACDAVASSFRRGDPNANGGTDISDAVAIFAFLFLGGSTPSCLDAADADDSGQINITDGIFLLGGLFLGTRLPPQPGPTTCGSDPTPDALPGCSYSPGLCTP